MRRPRSATTANSAKEMELFAFSQNVGAGSAALAPKGAALRDRLEQFLRKIQKKYGYQQVITPPHMATRCSMSPRATTPNMARTHFQPIHTPEEGEEYLHLQR